MRRILATLLYVFLSVSSITAHAVLNPGYTASWYNPAQNGHGFNFEMLENGKVLVYWYTYRPDGSSTFLFGVGDATGNEFTATLFLTGGMTFGDFDPDDNALTEWGSLTVSFIDCNNATASWNPALMGYTAGNTPIQRLSQVDGANCTDDWTTGNYQLEATSLGSVTTGRGMLLPDGTLMFATGQGPGIELVLGEWSLDGDDGFTISGNRYTVNTEGGTPVQGQGTRTADGFLATLGNASFNAVLLPSFQANIALGARRGNYDVIDVATGEATARVFIFPNGDVQGRADGNCDVRGGFEIPDTNFNQMIANLELHACEEEIVNLPGVAWWMDTALFLVILDESRDEAQIFLLNPDPGSQARP